MKQSDYQVIKLNGKLKKFKDVTIHELENMKKRELKAIAKMEKLIKDNPEINDTDENRLLLKMWNKSILFLDELIVRKKPN